MSIIEIGCYLFVRSEAAADAFLQLYGKGNGSKKTAGQKAAQGKKSAKIAR